MVECFYAQNCENWDKIKGRTVCSEQRVREPHTIKLSWVCLCHPGYDWLFKLLFFVFFWIETKPFIFLTKSNLYYEIYCKDVILVYSKNVIACLSTEEECYHCMASLVASKEKMFITQTKLLNEVTWKTVMQIAKKHAVSLFLSCCHKYYFHNGRLHRSSQQSLHEVTYLRKEL